MAAASSNQSFVIGPLHPGIPNDKTFNLQSSPVPQPKDGELLVKSLYISVDPYLRNRIPAMGEGKTMVSGLVAEVVESKADGFKPGDHVFFYGTWSRVQTINPKDADARLYKVDGKSVPLSTFVGVCGMPGATAYFGLKHVCALKAGDIVFISGAAGAVGSMVGQLARAWGAKLVVGSAGGAEKCKIVVEEFGFDACIDYKVFDTEAKVTAELKRISPDLYDVYFDNVGGHVSDAFYNVLRKHARIAICGQISMYNAGAPPMIPSPFYKLIYTAATVRGFLVFDFADQWGEFMSTVVPLVAGKKIKYEETIQEGFEKLPVALRGLFEGANVGKMVVKV